MGIPELKERLAKFRPAYPYGRVRTLQTIATFLVLSILLLTLRLYRERHPPPSIYDDTDGKTAGTWLNETLNPPRIPEEARYLTYLAREYGLSEEIPWFARRIKPSFHARNRESMTATGTSFLSHAFQKVQIDEEDLKLRVDSTVKLSLTQSAKPEALDASALIFGISTSYSRIIYANASLLHDWARWLTDGKGGSNGASLVLTLRHAGSSEVSHIASRLRELGIDSIVLSADESLNFTNRYIDLVRLLSQRTQELSKEGKTKKFLALVDDDVFFPSVGRLMARLNKFSARKKLYLGLPSERADWTVENNVTMTYGGGAVIFSKSMAESLAQLPCAKATATNSSSEDGGQAHWDETLYTCISQHTTQDMNVLPSFYTPEDDSLGLPIGYDSGLQPLTLHHYKHRHGFEPWKSHMVVSLCGEDCFLQRFRFRDRWILVNGYSLSHYPDGMDAVSLQKSSLLVAQENAIERVIKAAKRLVVGEVEGGRDRKVVSWKGLKRTWRLLDARVGAGGEVWQAYVRRKGEPPMAGDDELPEGDMVHTQEGSEVDSVIVLIWEP